jgi:sugar O-acyltransferase (sialic acid O-acetyltransferase NeuD family)
VIPLWVLGAGGHARVVIDAARSAGRFDVIGILDDTLMPGTHSVDGVPVKGPITAESVVSFDVTHAVIAIGSNSARHRIASGLDGLLSWEVIVHSRAYVAETAIVGKGTVVCAMSVVQPGSTIGQHVILNTASTADHDSALGDAAHLGPGVNLAGTTAVGEGTFMGIGSSVIPGCRIGAWSTVGAGAVVISDLPDNTTAVGVPARAVKIRQPGWHLE